MTAARLGRDALLTLALTVSLWTTTLTQPAWAVNCPCPGLNCTHNSSCSGCATGSCASSIFGCNAGSGYCGCGITCSKKPALCGGIKGQCSQGACCGATLGSRPCHVFCARTGPADCGGGLQASTHCGDDGSAGCQQGNACYSNGTCGRYCKNGPIGGCPNDFCGCGCAGWGCACIYYLECGWGGDCSSIGCQGDSCQCGYVCPNGLGTPCPGIGCNFNAGKGCGGAGCATGGCSSICRLSSWQCAGQQASCTCGGTNCECGTICLNGWQPCNGSFSCGTSAQYGCNADVLFPLLGSTKCDCGLLCSSKAPTCNKVLATCGGSHTKCPGTILKCSGGPGASCGWCNLKQIDYPCDGSTDCGSPLYGCRLRCCTSKCPVVFCSKNPAGRNCGQPPGTCTGSGCSLAKAGCTQSCGTLDWCPGKNGKTCGGPYDCWYNPPGCGGDYCDCPTYCTNVVPLCGGLAPCQYCCDTDCSQTGYYPCCGGCVDGSLVGCLVICQGTCGTCCGGCAGAHVP